MGIFETIAHAVSGGAATGGNTAAPAPAPAPAATETPAPAAPAQLTEDQIYAVLEKHAQERGQKLNYKTSIVDLMTAIGQDSSLDARKKLAGELGYTGDTGDSATMNIWLHKQTMDKLMNG